MTDAILLGLAAICGLVALVSILKLRAARRRVRDRLNR